MLIIFFIWNFEEVYIDISKVWLRQKFEVWQSFLEFSSDKYLNLPRVSLPFPDYLCCMITLSVPHCSSYFITWSCLIESYLYCISLSLYQVTNLMNQVFAQLLIHSFTHSRSVENLQEIALRIKRVRSGFSVRNWLGQIKYKLRKYNSLIQ